MKINKLAYLFFIIILIIFMMCSCAGQNLADMTYENGDGYMAIVWEGRTYLPYGALAGCGERGKQIGIVDGDKDDRVYELKGYSTDEWIVNQFPHDASMLLKEASVTEIPDGWQSEYEWNQ